MSNAHVYPTLSVQDKIEQLRQQVATSCTEGDAHDLARVRYWASHARNSMLRAFNLAFLRWGTEEMIYFFARLAWGGLLEEREEFY